MICDECETVAHCMKNGCVPKHQALERMAENARELGLDYEQPAPVQQEPVAIVAVDGVGQIQVGWITKPQHNDKLYTSPPAQRTWVGLSDLDIDELENEYMKSAQTAHQFLRAIEAKLRGKNT